MSSREVVIWLDERWYNALSKKLKDETLEDRLGDSIDELIGKLLPEKEQERISHEIWEERQKAAAEAEANRTLAVFHTVEHGRHEWFLTEHKLELLDTARILRSYLTANGQIRGGFAGYFSHREKITPDTFRTFAAERMENTGRVTGAYEINLDTGAFEALNIMDGWQCYRIKDVSTAAFKAFRKQGLSEDTRWRILLDELHGKEITSSTEPGYLSGERRLTAEDISIAEDIIQNDNRLEFYLEVTFDPDKVFGTEVCTADSDDWINVYAEYDMDAREVCDELTVIYCGSDGDTDYKYRLSEEEKSLIKPKMDAHCLRLWDKDLEDCVEEYLEEQAEEQSPAPKMQM